jgi:hypothetical protein
LPAINPQSDLAGPKRSEFSGIAFAGIPIW